MANPGQDGDEANDPTKNMEKRQEVLQRREQRHDARMEKLSQRGSRD